MASFAASVPVGAHHRSHPSLCTGLGARSQTARRTRMCAPAAPAPPTEAEIEKLFSRLSHKNQALRHAASSSLAAIADANTIARLLELLSVSDTSHRRAAVQALGMAGAPAVMSVTGVLRETGDLTVRASCAKALAAAALFHPDMRAEFPSDAVTALREAIVGGDPVTKIAAIGCLGTLGCDAKDKDGNVLPGNKAAFEILGKLLGEGLDVAIGAVAVGAVAQIGQNGTPERKAEVIAKLKELAGEGGDDDEESGFGYVKEMARNHVEQLEGGPKVPSE